MNLHGRIAVVVGGTAAAAAKARLLLAAGADVRVIAPSLESDFDGLTGETQLSHVARPFNAHDVSDAALVFTATTSPETDRSVVEAARRRGVPVNAVDQPDLSDFIMPAIIDRDPVTVAISSAGTAPVLARIVRRRIEAILPGRLGALARFAARFRGAVGKVVMESTQRRRLWERALEGPVADAVLRGDESTAHCQMMALLNTPPAASDLDGRVVLVGAGPGDPDLLTLRALNQLEKADVVVHDRLVSTEVLDRVRREAKRIDVGKAPGRHAMGQEAINALLARLASEGQRVVRLKGGDPFIFGRGGEEVAYLRGRGISVEVVPGITAAIGCAASACLPLTMRGMASAVTFVTGHGGSETGSDNIDWRALATSGATLAVYMGRATCAGISAELMAGGMAPDTPVAIIENGTQVAERIFAGQLGGLADLMAAMMISGPSLIVIGPVAGLAQISAEHTDLSQALRHAAG